MHAAGSVSPIAYFLQDKPRALAELGEAVLKISYPTINHDQVPHMQRMQVGYIVTQVMLDRSFPEINLADTTTYDSYKITKINSTWVKNVIFQDNAVEVPTFAIYVNRDTKSQSAPTTLDDLEQNGIAISGNQESIDRVVNHLANGFKRGMSTLSPQAFANNAHGWIVQQLRIFSQMKSCQDRYQKPYSEIDSTLTEYCKTGQVSLKVAACMQKAHMLYAMMAQDLATKFK